MAWLPVSIVSAVALLVRFAFQLRLGGNLVEVSDCASSSASTGCDRARHAPTPTLPLPLPLLLPRCNLQWAGLDQIAASDWQLRSFELLLQLLPRHSPYPYP